MTVGHEYVGEIVEVGQGVTDGVKVGDRVSGEGHLVCGICLTVQLRRRLFSPLVFDEDLEKLVF